MADEINVRYTADTKQIEESVNRVQKELLETDAIGKKTFSNMGASSDQAAKSIDKVTQAAAKQKTQFNGLSSSINQISRELPNFAMNAQIGFLAISNNLPILADAISNVRKQNEALIASGQKSIPVWKQVGAAIFGWQTALTVGITLLTLYGSKIVSFIGDLIKGSSALDETRLKVESLNEAFSDGAVSKAVSEYLKLQAEVRGAKLGFVDKEATLKKYNDTIGKTLGTTNNLNAAEKILNDNKQEYIKMVVEKTAALQLFDKTASLMVKRQELANKEFGFFDVFIDRAFGQFGVKGMAERRGDALAALDKEIKTTGQLAEKLMQPYLDVPAAKEKKKKEKKDKDELQMLLDQQERLFQFKKKYLEDEAALEKSIRDNAINVASEDRKKQEKAAEEALKREEERIKYLADARIMAAQNVANVLGALSSFVGETTVEGKALAISEATISTYLAATKILAADAGKGGVAAIISAGAAIAFGLIQVAKIIATEVPTPNTSVPQFAGASASRGTGAGAGFATGVVDLQGPGTTTSDSIPARLSRGESVITAKATAAKKDELFALNYSVLNYDKLIQDKYVKPAIEAERRKQESFASNIATAIHLHNSMGEKKIVKAIQESGPVTAKAVEKQTRVLIANSRKSEFVTRRELK